MKRLLLTLGLITLSTPALATPVSYTGIELAALSGANFPNGGQSFVGDGLRVDPAFDNAVLFRLDLDDFVVDPSDIGISINLQRLLNDNSFTDQDIRIGIFNGTDFFHTFFFDNNVAQFRPVNSVASLNGGETGLGTTSGIDTGPIVAAPFGAVAQLEVTIQATGSSTTIISEINQTGAFSSLSTDQLGIGGGLSLILIGNNSAENYLIDRVTFTSGVSVPTSVPEPGGLGLAFMGLTALGLYRRRAWSGLSRGSCLAPGIRC